MVFFSAGKGGGQGIAYGYKGKGVTSHLLVDGEGSPVAILDTPANGDERKQVIPLISLVESRISKACFPIFEADKGYDAESLRDSLLKKRIFPWICRRKKKGLPAAKIESKITRFRWKVERAIAWLQRKFRRIAVRWERKSNYWRGVQTIALVGFWLDRLLG